MKRTRLIALITCTALLNPAVAYAGPDDGKKVGTQTHIDAPKAYWVDNNFELRALKDTKLDDAVLWVGKGYHGRTGEQQYQYTLPENNLMSDLGKPGQTFYTAPRNPGWNQDPIWWGFGADTEIPTEQFQQESAAMDLLSVEGPGDVAMFVDYGDGTGLNRMWGNTEKSPKSVKLHKGLHTHNSTLFTKPGRYVLTYRSTARTTDGKLVTSAPQSMAVQVGGQQPKDAPTPSLKERFDAAPQGSGAYTLSISAPNEENLSAIEFKADKPVNGTLTLMIDGYFLTDLDVTDGAAKWEEMLGPLHSDIQAVFTSDDDRWVSAPVHYHGEAVSTQESADEWTDNTGTAREVQSTEERTLTNNSVTTHVEHVDDETLKFTVNADPNFSGFIEGGFYDTPEDVYATDPVEVPITDGKAEVLLSNNEWLKGTTLRFNVIPHPLVKATGGQVTMTENYDPATPLTHEFALTANTPVAEEPAPKTQRCEGALVLDRGHIDIKAMREGDKFVTSVKDETGLHDSKTVDRKLDDVLVAVHENAKTKKPEQLSFDYLDDEFYLLPQVQNRDIIWPGYNTQELNYDEFDGPVLLNLKPKTAPGKWGLFVGDGFTGFRTLASSTGSHSIETTYAAHTHANWVFGQAGTYEFEVTYSAKTKDGKDITSDPQTLTFAVGDKAVQECGAVPTPEPTPTPSESEKPSEPEKPKPSESEKPSEPKKPTESKKPKPAEPKEQSSSESPWTWVGVVVAILAVVGGIGAAIANPTLLKSFLR